MTTIFDGDPLITIDADGAEMNFTGGQPEMDTGFVNHVNFSLLTKKGWWGNDLVTLPERKLASKYMETDLVKKGIITRKSLIDADRAAELDVKGDEFGLVAAQTSNPTSQNVLTEVLYTPPTRDVQKLVLTRTGQNWLSISQGNS